MIRFKDGVAYTIHQRHVLPATKLPVGMRALTSDWTVRLPGWDGALLLRLFSYQLSDGKLIRVLTDRADLSALAVAQLYKERWTIENWWRWLKRLYKVKEPLQRQCQRPAVADRSGLRHRLVAARVQTGRRVQR